MILRLHGIHLRYDINPKDALPAVVKERLGDRAPSLKNLKVIKKSIDARNRPVQFVYTVDIEVDKDFDTSWPGVSSPTAKKPLKVESGREPLMSPPIVIGGGPAGLFAALLLAEHGYAPLLLERGGNVEERKAGLRKLSLSRNPDPENNALFGLGGAGTFSDGKLNTGLSHPWLAEVLEVLIECGAPVSIRVDARPHVGTDILSVVVKKLAERIEHAGGTVRTQAKVEGLHMQSGKLTGIQSLGEKLDAQVAVLAIGHSARDTWQCLADAGIALEPKPFQMGIRVEHPQGWIDHVRYGEAAGHPALGAADYKLAGRADGLPVFTFCMCPGGETIPTVNEPGYLALNGMSDSKRNTTIASSGLVVTLSPEVYGGRTPEACIAFQRTVERTCFQAGGGDYSAPAQRLRDFVKGRKTTKLPWTNYRLGIKSARLDEILPKFVALPLRHALIDFNQKLKGYLHQDALALAPESRASSPIRIVRHRETGETMSLSGIYPVGEGAGYSGGIMSSALDGLSAARKIIERFAPPTGTLNGS